MMILGLPDAGLIAQLSEYRLGIFLTLFVLLAIWEALHPARKPRFTRLKRWFCNISLSTLNSFTIYVLSPTSLVGVAILAQQRKWGLFPLLEVHDRLATVLAVIILDFIIYVQHVLAHQWPPLWRLHRVHHADQDVDLTTGARFHTLEIVLSFGFKALVVLLLGTPALSVALFEIILSSMALFNHSNVTLPQTLEKIIRPFFVTPDIHRIHHSTKMIETNSNYGFNLSIWDRWFGTYRAHYKDQLEIGLSEFPDACVNHSLWGVLLMPFRR